MNEQEWPKCSNPRLMLDGLKGKTSERKLRLFACASARQLFVLDAQDKFLNRYFQNEAKILTAERFADRLETKRQLREARKHPSHPSEILPISPTMLLYATVSDSAWRGALHSAGAWLSSLKQQEWLPVQANLVREIIGNPFRPVTIEPAILTWRDRTIPKLAQAAYDERELPSGHLDTKRLAILADALEESGCTNEDVLAHLRGAGPHVRGCWVVDLLLGRE